MKQRDTIKDTVEKFIGYLRNPTEEQDFAVPIEVKVKTLVYLFLFSLLATCTFSSYAHFFNYSNYDKLWTWIIVLVFPQLIIGSILGYIRVRFSY